MAANDQFTKLKDEIERLTSVMGPVSIDTRHKLQELLASDPQITADLIRDLTAC